MLLKKPTLLLVIACQILLTFSLASALTPIADFGKLIIDGAEPLNLESDLTSEAKGTVAH